MNRKIFSVCALIIGVYAGRAFAVDTYTLGDPNKSGSVSIKMICTDYQNGQYPGDKYKSRKYAGSDVGIRVLGGVVTKRWYHDDEQKLFKDYHKSGKSVYFARIAPPSIPWQLDHERVYSMSKVKREGNKFSRITGYYGLQKQQMIEEPRRVCRMYFIFNDYPRTPGLREPRRVPEAKDVK